MEGDPTLMQESYRAGSRLLKKLSLAFGGPEGAGDMCDDPARVPNGGVVR